MLAVGDALKVEQLIQWLWQGPLRAQVHHVAVDWQEMPQESLQEFKIRAD